MTENIKRLYRSTNDIMLAGVCSGIAKYASLDPTVVRLLFVMAFFFTGPGILLAYLILMIIVPTEQIIT